MITERQQLPSLSEIDKRKATMRKAVFGALVSTSATSSHLGRESKSALAGGTTKIDEKYSEADVARLVDARRKRSEAVTGSASNVLCVSCKIAHTFRLASRNDKQQQ